MKVRISQLMNDRQERERKTENHGSDLLGCLEQWMVAAHDLAQVHGQIAEFVVHDPTQVHEGR